MLWPHGFPVSLDLLPHRFILSPQCLFPCPFARLTKLSQEVRVTAGAAVGQPWRHMVGRGRLQQALPVPPAVYILATVQPEPLALPPLDAGMTPLLEQ